jgi:hypothetical protein
MIKYKKMRKIVFTFLVMIMLPVLTMAQKFEIMPFAGYMLGGSVHYLEGKLNVNDGAVYGGSLIVADIKYSTDLELSYSHMASTADFNAYPGYGLFDQTVDMSTNYLQIGAIKKMQVSEKFIPLFSISAGATWFTSSEYEAVWRFSVAMGGGAEIFITDRIGIMLRARLLLPMNFAGVGGWCGIGTGGSGCGLSMNSYSVVTQGDFTGGLIFKLGK